MQKRELKWSVLIWSIFLSLIISLSFIYVSTKINQNIRLNNFLDESLENTDFTEPLNSEYLLNEQKIYTIKNEENIIFSFSWTSTFTWTLKIKSWGPIYYETIAYSWTLVNSLIYSWVISNTNSTVFTWFLDSTYNKSILNIKSIWGLSTIIIDSNLDYKNIWKSYRIVKEIWWKSVEKTSFEK